MTQVDWITVSKIQCKRTGEEAALLEQRAYLGDPLPDVCQPYKVLARKCSTGEACNLSGFSCRWAYTNPNYDPFAL
ncbi:MAG TPA: hypothetical protein VI793_04745 [Anaerolineales bacterium]|nr:hypothetical protein [Anaerolineales bacterium]